MIYTNKGFEIKTTCSARADKALTSFFNADNVMSSYQDYLMNAQDVSNLTSINAYQLLALKDYMVNVASHQGYHCFHLKKDGTITKQIKLNKTFARLEDWFIRDEHAVTSFKELYDHYLNQCIDTPLGKVNFSKKMREWGVNSISKLKMVNKKPIRALTGISIRQATTESK